MERIQSFYDYDYYEAGHQTGKSGYSNYRWLGEPTIQMAQAISTFCGVSHSNSILDYGCAKGFLVKALRLSGFENSFGCDISSYAISNCDSAVKDFLYLIEEGTSLKSVFPDKRFDWVFSKDVFEHIPLPMLSSISADISNISTNMFVAVPLGDGDGKFVIPEYHNDQSCNYFKCVGVGGSALRELGG